MSSYVTNIMIQAALEDLKGNPEAVHSGASQMQTTGNQLNDAARAVDKLVSSTDEVTSDAFKALGEKALWPRRSCAPQVSATRAWPKPFMNSPMCWRRSSRSGGERPPRPKVPSPGGIMRNNSIKPRC